VGQQVAELYGFDTRDVDGPWPDRIAAAACCFLGRRCIKSRKSSPDLTIGTCTVEYGPDGRPLMICPFRMLERRRVFADALHLLTAHEPGNDLHVVPEFSVPGGSIDYMLVSVRRDKPVDFVGIELQTLDTTGSVWPARERFCSSVGVATDKMAELSKTTFGVNWKMSAKTILVQMHHKLGTFEHVNRKLVLALQDDLLAYMRGAFRFDHLSSPPSAADAMHFHAYALQDDGASLELQLAERVSTDDDGMARALGLQAASNIDLDQIFAGLAAKLSQATRWTLV
jgi:Restriction endonuclease NotI